MMEKCEQIIEPITRRFKLRKFLSPLELNQKIKENIIFILVYKAFSFLRQ